MILSVQGRRHSAPWRADEKVIDRKFLHCNGWWFLGVSELVAAALFRQPFTNCLTDHPALAPVDPFDNLVQLNDQGLRQLRSDNPTVVSRVYSQSSKALC
jgi:hypothetical protein